MPIAVAGGRELGKRLGLVPLPVQVVGTGSMYPSLFWDESEGGPDNSAKAVVEEYRTAPQMYRNYGGVTVAGRTFLKTRIAPGDMVAFQSDATKAVLAKEGKEVEAGFIKRVIAVDGEQIELRDGFVKKNGELLTEPYIYKPRSTYGDLSLPDCQVLTIPRGFVFVLGDNRKVSSDSRGELGLVKLKDISFVLPFAKQALYFSLWRDPSQDALLSGTPSLDRQEFYTLINQERQKRGLPSLKIDQRLEKSSTLLAGRMLQNNSQYKMANALSEAGYKNIITSEFSIKGRFSAEELVQNLLYFGNTSTQILDPNLQDIGVSDVSAEVNGCPTEMIVGHLGGFKEAEYSQETLESWRRLRDNLREVLPSWESAVQYAFLSETKLAELLSLYRKRLSLAEEILSTMENHAWLTPTQVQRLKDDEADAVRAEQLARELGGE